jgi:hypothetical protein
MRAIAESSTWPACYGRTDSLRQWRCNRFHLRRSRLLLRHSLQGRSIQVRMKGCEKRILLSLTDNFGQDVERPLVGVWLSLHDLVPAELLYEVMVEG